MPDEKKKNAFQRQAESYKKLNPAGKRNAKLFFLAGLAAIAFMAWSLFSSGKPPADTTNVDGVRIQSTKAGVDRAERYSTVNEGYEETLRAASEQRRGNALRTGQSYISDVSEYEWANRTGENQQSFNWRADFDDPNSPYYLGELTQEELEALQFDENGNPILRGEGRRETVGPAGIDRKKLEDRIASGAITNYGDGLYGGEVDSEEVIRRRRAEEEAQRRRERQSRERQRQNEGGDYIEYRVLTPTEEAELANVKSQALSSYVRTSVSPPAGGIMDHTEFESERLAREEERASNSSQNRNLRQVSVRQPSVGGSEVVFNRTVEDDGTGAGALMATGGVVPGDRFYGFTRMPINSDVSRWVDVEITSGPLRGAIVGMQPERVEGHVVLMSDTITLGRKTAPFRAMALNPESDLSPAFSSETNHRRMARYGATALAAITGTVHELIGMQSSQTQTNNSTTQEVKFDSKDLLVAGAAAGVAEIGRDIGREAQARPPTVKVDRLHRVVLVVIQEQEISWLKDPLIIERF